MSDACTVAGIVGKRGSGKSSLLKLYLARAKRSLVWDWKGEYEGTLVERFEELPELLAQPRFRAVYRAPRWGTTNHFDALAHVLLHLGADFLFAVDEVATVCDGYAEGGLGQLLRYSRDQHIDIAWASQRPCKIPGVYLSEVNRMHVFHLHNKHDLSALAEILPADNLARVAALPPHEYLTVHL